LQSVDKGNEPAKQFNILHNNIQKLEGVLEDPSAGAKYKQLTLDSINCMREIIVYEAKNERLGYLESTVTPAKLGMSLKELRAEVSTHYGKIGEKNAPGAGAKYNDKAQMLITVNNILQELNPPPPKEQDQAYIDGLKENIKKIKKAKVDYKEYGNASRFRSSKTEKLVNDALQHLEAKLQTAEINVKTNATPAPAAATPTASNVNPTHAAKAALLRSTEEDKPSSESNPNSINPGT
jgi:hypothetical protein